MTLPTSQCLPVSPNQVHLMLLVFSDLIDTGEEAPGRGLVALAAPQTVTSHSNKENQGSYSNFYLHGAHMYFIQLNSHHLAVVVSIVLQTE